MKSVIFCAWWSCNHITIHMYSDSTICWWNIYDCGIQYIVSSSFLDHLTPLMYIKVNSISNAFKHCYVSCSLLSIIILNVYTISTRLHKQSHSNLINSLHSEVDHSHLTWHLLPWQNKNHTFFQNKYSIKDLVTSKPYTF